MDSPNNVLCDNSSFFLFFVNNDPIYPFSTIAAMLEIKAKSIICCVLALGGLSLDYFNQIKKSSFLKVAIDT